MTRQWNRARAELALTFRALWLVVAATLTLGLAACATPAAETGFAPPPAVVVEAWAGAVEEIVTDRPTVFYRAYGGEANRFGAWLSPVPPTTRQAVIQSMALPPMNTAEFYSIVTVPAGVRMKVGIAAPAFGQPGGGRQVQLLQLIPAEAFSEPMPLP